MLLVFRLRSFNYKRCLLLFIICVLLVFIHLNYSNQRKSVIYIRNSVQDSLPFTTNKTSGKIILLWTKFFGSLKYIPVGKDALKKEGCPEHRCEITSDRNKLEQSEAVVFHCRDIDITDIPKTRFPYQRWVFYCLESPHHSYFPAFRFMKLMFNWTMSYRLDSDVVSSYGTYKKRDKILQNKNMKSIWQNKIKMAVWLVSNCQTPGKREKFVESLKKYIHVDIFGTCGGKVCPHDKIHDCMLDYAKNYMYFLSFENSICKDYVTEKFYRMLDYDIIPIVFGGASYDVTAPPNSYINALNYKNVSHLAEHLQQIANNYTLYSSYFSWKEKYYLPPYVPLICELCKQLYVIENIPYKIYDISDWWIDQAHCRSWDE